MSTVFIPRIPILEANMPAGRKTRTKSSARLERIEKLRDRIVQLPNELRDEGINLPDVFPIALTEPEPDVDPKTGASIGKVKEPLATYIQRASIIENQSQRPGFDHMAEPVYRRLIWDFLKHGALLPEAKVAALGAKDNEPVKSLDESDIRYSVIDGLQRLYCMMIAILLVLRGQVLVSDGLMTIDAWKYFEEAVNELHAKAGGAAAATAKLLARTVRYEIFYNLDLPKLVSYMVTYNTAQKRMSLQHQLEIMQAPVVNKLRAGIEVFDDLKRMPGMTKPKDRFAASDLLLAIRAFITNNPQVSADEEAERLLEVDDFSLDNVGDFDDLFQVLIRICTQLHPQIVTLYGTDTGRAYILSHSKIFLIGLAAACGHIRNNNNMKMLDGALDKLTAKLRSPDEDPLNLEGYAEATNSVTSSRGKSLRALVYTTFKQYFYGATPDLDWKDSLSLISG